MERKAVGGDEQQLEKHEQVEEVAGEEGAVQAGEQELHERNEPEPKANIYETLATEFSALKEALKALKVKDGQLQQIIASYQSLLEQSAKHSLSYATTLRAYERAIEAEDVPAQNKAKRELDGFIMNRMQGALLEEAFKVQRAARAQLRWPLNNRAQNTMVVVDTNGEILGLVRGPDALVDAIDAVPQKARTTAFFSSPFAAGDLLANPTPGVADYVAAVRTFLGDPAALTGGTAFSLRAIGNLSRPWFPDGEVGNPPGPLSIPFERFNIFSTGLQSRLITQDILDHVAFVLNLAANDVPRICTRNPVVPATGRNRINNGITLFAGGVPIYRNGVLVGAIAASGDGNDQSDMIAFLGLHNAGIRLGGALGNAPPAIRADLINVPLAQGSSNLRYVRCPFNPFVGSNDQNVCQGK